MNQFAEALTQLLHERGMSQNALARILGLSSSAVSYWITGQTQPSRENVQAIEDELDVDPRGSLLTLAGYSTETNACTVESAIRADPELSREDRRALLYLLRQIRARVARGEAD